MLNMGIQEEIKQSRFTSEYQKAFINIMYTHNFLIDKVNDTFKKHDITRQQFNVLRILRGNLPEPSNINYIKERMLDKMSDASRIVERLRIKGLIKREINKLDRRAVDIHITDKGMNLLDEMDDSVKKFEAPINNLSAEEATQLNNLLDKVRESR